MHEQQHSANGRPNQNGNTQMSSTNGNLNETDSLDNQNDVPIDGMLSETSTLSPTNQEIVRLIGQHLISVGLNRSAELLMTESGCRLDHPVAAKFRQHVMDANWTKVEVDLEHLKSLIMDPEDALNEMKFLILEQKYLEYLEENRLFEALHVLRSELTPLNYDTSRVHQLSSYIVCSDRQELLSKAHWAGKGTQSRTILMEKLQNYLPADVVLPPRRLLTLLNQSLELQTQKCKYHNMAESITLDNTSLLADHMCTKDSFPKYCIQVLDEHMDEIWFCQFSPDGTKLATGSKDTNVIIWDVDPDECSISIRRILEGHSCGAAILCWNPDSIHILVCGPEDTPEVWLWNTETDKLLKVSQSSDDVLTTVAWNNDGTKFAAGGIRGHFYQCDMSGNVLDSWEGVRVNWLGYRKNSKHILAADTHNRIRSYNFDELSDTHILKEDQSILSFAIDKTDTYAALNVMTQGIHLYDINDRSLVRKFRGGTQNTFRIHSCFGGLHHEFVASGSEDNKIYIWHISRERPLIVLQGHTKTVNCVDWNPVHPHIIASVSDDTTVRIWGPKQHYDEMNRQIAETSERRRQENLRRDRDRDQMIT